jgi:hypothetical protein
MAIVSNILIGINTLTFLILSGIHVYWAFGGRWGIASAIPTTMDNRPAFVPGIFATLIVAFGLLFFAFITISNLGIFNFWIEFHYIRIGMWGMITIFYIRAVGDFKQVGLFKKIKGTVFANNDTKYYSPLCLYLATSSLIVVLLQNA